MRFRTTIPIGVLSLCLGCEEIPADGGGAGGSGAGDPSGVGGSGGNPFEDGTVLDVPTEPGPTYVDLDGPALVGASDAWELKLDGVDVYTNGGASGAGSSRAFGPLDALVF